MERTVNALQTLSALDIASIYVAGTISKTNLYNGNIQVLICGFTPANGGSGTAGVVETYILPDGYTITQPNALEQQLNLSSSNINLATLAM